MIFLKKFLIILMAPYESGGVFSDIGGTGGRVNNFLYSLSVGSSCMNKKHSYLKYIYS